jgi:hypothetical protein
MDETDIILDQSTRVARRVAYGTYWLSHAGAATGEEAWGVFALRSGGFRILADIAQTWPVPNQQRVRIDLDAGWRVERLWAQVDMEGARRSATYAPAGGEIDIQIIEARLRQEDDSAARRGLSKAGADGTDAAVRVQRPAQARARVEKGRLVSHQRLPWNPGAHLDFGSALFNTIALRRAALRADAPLALDSIVLTLPSLEPLRIAQEYLYERDEPVRGDETRPAARRYRIREQTAKQAATTFWADDRHIVLAQELELDGAPHACDIGQYVWAG